MRGRSGAAGRVERMDIVEITEPDDPRLADYRDLTDVALRRVREPAEGLYIAESAKVLSRALSAGHRPRSCWFRTSGSTMRGCC